MSENNEKTSEEPSETDRQESSNVEAVDVVPTSPAKEDAESSSSVSVASATAVGSAIPEKIQVILNPVADAPILKQKKWTVPGAKTVSWVASCLRKLIKLDDAETIFLYVSQRFAPSLDQTIENLYRCYGADGKLMLHYSKAEAWG